MTDREIRLSALERRYVKAARIHKELTRMENRKPSRLPEQREKELQAIVEWQIQFDRLVGNDG
jgi:hypothetical protein